MKRDFSNVPKDVTIKNTTNETIKFRLRNILIEIPVGETVKLTVETSEEYAIVQRILDKTEERIPLRLDYSTQGPYELDGTFSKLVFNEYIRFEKPTPGFESRCYTSGAVEFYLNGKRYAYQFSHMPASNAGQPEYGDIVLIGNMSALLPNMRTDRPALLYTIVEDYETYYVAKLLDTVVPVVEGEFTQVLGGTTGGPINTPPFELGYVVR